MYRRKIYDKSAIVTKEFTEGEIINGIEKLKRRINEVQSLSNDNVAFDDERVKNVEHNIREAVRKIFGDKSPEFSDHQYHGIWHGDINMMDTGGVRQSKFLNGIPQTIIMIEGLMARLNEKQADLKSNSFVQKKMDIKNLDIHPIISAVCIKLYNDEHYGDAVFAASKSLINYVKERSGKYDLDGAPLMRTVFSKNTPILAFSQLKDQTDLDEQEGMMHLFEGTVLAIRNPRGHSFPEDSPEEALEWIGFLSLLAKRLEKATKFKF